MSSVCYSLFMIPPLSTNTPRGSPSGRRPTYDDVEEASVGKADRDAVLAAADINADANAVVGGGVHGVACIGQMHRFVRRSR